MLWTVAWLVVERSRCAFQRKTARHPERWCTAMSCPTPAHVALVEGAAPLAAATVAGTGATIAGGIVIETGPTHAAGIAALLSAVARAPLASAAAAAGAQQAGELPAAA